MNAPDDPKMFDVRTIERKLRRGLVGRKEYEKYLKSLPDRTGNASHVPVSQPGWFTDDDDDDE